MKKLRIFNFDWKYIIGEILLLFVGINLAIWFNNWNSSKTIEKNKAIAVEKITGEITNNISELQKGRVKNRRIPLFFNKLKAVSSKRGEYVLMSIDEMDRFRDEYSRFYKVIDSVKDKNGKYRYTGDTFINLEIPELSKIAWETSKTTGIFNEFGFDCLYELEGMHNLQELVTKEVGNAVSALQQGNIERLLRVLEFLDQMDRQLEEDYKKVLENLDGCG